MKLLITLLVTLGISMGSYGYSGNTLLSFCDSENDTQAMGCGSYILGVIDAYRALSSMHKPNINHICFPDGVNRGQQNKVIVKYLKDHPEHLHYTAADTILAALNNAFPCEK